MCGVIGYVGHGAAPEFFYNGLKHLEYRGYDSAGIAMCFDGDVLVVRAEGKLSQLEKKLGALPQTTTLGMGHTRWATHGRPSEVNAHPHRSGPIILLHNGIIENYKPLKQMLLEKNFIFQSETDTEVVAHLMHLYYRNGREQGLPPEESIHTALLKTAQELHGAFAFGIICLDVPETLYTLKYGSPLVVGFGKNACYIASGIAALVEHTKEILVLEDGDLAVLKPQGASLYNFNGQTVTRPTRNITWSLDMLEKNGFDHFMRKEISEEPTAVAQTLNHSLWRNSGLVDVDSLGGSVQTWQHVERLGILACGTSYYAGCVARYFIEKWSRVPVMVDLASEFRYRHPLELKGHLYIALSQSGETIDTLHAIRQAQAQGARALAIVNAPGSTIAHHAEHEYLLQAGPEVGVASTKAFVAQISALLLVGLGLSQSKKTLNELEIASVTESLVTAPSLMEGLLAQESTIKAMAETIKQARCVLFMGRQALWPVAQEGALKLKELAYLPAEGYAGGELKHGPIALVDEQTPLVCLCPKNNQYQKMLSNIEEVKARGGRIFAIGTHNDVILQEMSEYFISLPACDEHLEPLLAALPLHLLAYHTALALGHDVDQPRNLAKSVTVE